MTISSKGSRKITVEHEKYRWVISPSSKGHIMFTAQHEQGKGQIIRVNIESDVNDYWIEFPNIEKQQVRIIKPAEASMIISDAIVLGWAPKEKGKPLTFDLIGTTLKKRDT